MNAYLSGRIDQNGNLVSEEDSQLPDSVTKILLKNVPMNKCHMMSMRSPKRDLQQLRKMMAELTRLGLVSITNAVGSRVPTTTTIEYEIKGSVELTNWPDILEYLETKKENAAKVNAKYMKVKMVAFAGADDEDDSKLPASLEDPVDEDSDGEEQSPNSGYDDYERKRRAAKADEKVKLAFGNDGIDQNVVKELLEKHKHELSKKFFSFVQPENVRPFWELLRKQCFLWLDVNRKNKALATGNDDDEDEEEEEEDEDDNPSQADAASSILSSGGTGRKSKGGRPAKVSARGKHASFSLSISYPLSGFSNAFQVSQWKKNDVKVTHVQRRTLERLLAELYKSFKDKELPFLNHSNPVVLEMASQANLDPEQVLVYIEKRNATVAGSEKLKLKHVKEVRYRCHICEARNEAAERKGHDGTFSRLREMCESQLSLASFHVFPDAILTYLMRISCASPLSYCVLYSVL